MYDMQVITFIFAVIFTALTLIQWKCLARAGPWSTIDWKDSLVYSWIKSLEGFFLKRTIGVQTLDHAYSHFLLGIRYVAALFQPIVLIV